MVVIILAKNTEKQGVIVNFSERSLVAYILLPDHSVYNLDICLAHKVLPQKCSYKLMQSKIEIKLAKSDSIQWTKLEGEPEKDLPKQSPFNAGPPKYPSSNLNHRDWNAIEKDILQEMASEEKDGKDGVNQLFQKIYGEGSEEVKRAMNKSYIESGGTVLSTNWNEISKEKVPVKPPDGMEWKEWTK